MRDRLAAPIRWAEIAYINKMLASTSYDAVFAPVASDLLPFSKIRRPVVYLSDATFKLLKNYPHIQALSRGEAKRLDMLERKSIALAAACVYSSAWAAKSAVDDYGASANKVFVVPFGPNLDWIPARVARLPQVANSINLLFVGREWDRKGGDVAVATVNQLRNTGIDARLVVVGSNPPPNVKCPHIQVFPYIDKRSDDGRAKLTELYERADAFILPTKADCTPVVMSEAAAFGLPVFTFDVGGMRTLVNHETTGIVLPPDAGAPAFVEAIRTRLSDGQSLRIMGNANRSIFEEELNWQRFGEQISRILATVEASCIRETAPSPRR